jgi:hypothetical protein
VPTGYAATEVRLLPNYFSRFPEKAKKSSQDHRKNRHFVFLKRPDFFPPGQTHLCPAHACGIRMSRLLAPPCHHDFLEKLKMTKIRGWASDYFILAWLIKAPSIITPPGVFGVTTSTNGENPKK